MMASAGGGGGLNIEDVFSTYLYEGTGSTQTITNNVDLSGEGGLLWIKSKNFADHFLFDTERGMTSSSSPVIITNSVGSQNNLSNYLIANSDGFTLGTNATGTQVNALASPPIGYTSWTFRKAPKFFDVVTYTGNGTERSISHNLGCDVGFIVIKRVDTSAGWPCFHRSLGNDECIFLNYSSAAFSTTTRIRSASSTTFTVGTTSEVNASGGSYVAYLFAHNNSDGDFGPTGDQDIIKCGVYSGNSSDTGPSIDLGFEPQWLMIKRATGSADWYMFDNMRGVASGYSRPDDKGYDSRQKANTKDEVNFVNNFIGFSPTGFDLDNANDDINKTGQNYIYIAIRRGPMAVPTSGADVFSLNTYSGTGASQNITASIDAPDFALSQVRNASGWSSPIIYDRSRGNNLGLFVDQSSAEINSDAYGAVVVTNAQRQLTVGNFGSSSGKTYVTSSLRRAPNFFDIATYNGDGVAGRTVTHNLGAVPDMMWVRKRQQTSNWEVYLHSEGGTKRIYLDVTNAIETTSSAWNNTDATDTEFTLGTSSQTNQNGGLFVAYLFASLAGVSKIGTYTGNGSSQTINCGFSSGARFVLVKRIDGTGSWYYWDTSRGIVSGNDPHLSLDINNAEVTTDDSIDPVSSGFSVNQVSATNINVSSAKYMFYAIA